MASSDTHMTFQNKMLRNAFFGLIYLSLLTFQIALADENGRLSILLTNDDGYDAVGIMTLKGALRAAGYKVMVVAPATERSGSSAAIDFAPLRFEQVGPQDWKLDATPATCVFVALGSLLDRPPDLVISGTNIGSNVGAVTPFSGTVGATMAALNAPFIGLQQPVPAIAISTDPPVAEEQDGKAFRQHFVQVAGFAVELVKTLSAHGELTLPSGIALNVNYPGLAPQAVKGVVITTQGRSLNFTFRIKQKTIGAETLLLPEIINDHLDVSDPPGSDVAAFREGYITVTPLDGDYTASRRLDSSTHLAVEAIAPK